jgi:transposase
LANLHHVLRHYPRLHKIGIVALARKLLIALWHYLENGEPPPGATLKSATA